jgi:ADP-ribosyl-[dinitrogen reductase] hydrolase
MHEDAIIGCLLGMAIGDALGLPREGLSLRRAERLVPNLDRFNFIFGRGMFSDDTEHACMTGQSLLVSAGDPDLFISNLARRLRWWLLGLPFATGRATLKSCIKLWLGCSPKSSGVWSAGNGPAMRAPIIGVCFGERSELMPELVRRSTRITHRDPKAEWGALAIALAAHLAAESRNLPFQSKKLAACIIECLPPEAAELASLVERAAASVERGATTEAFAGELGLSRGVSGYMFHTVPIVLHAWLRHPDDYRGAVQSAIRCGGDADTTAAIVGALAGARLGKDAIPAAWRHGLCEWPRDLRWMEKLGVQLAKMLADGKPRRHVPLSVFGVFTRNLLFDFVVLGHVVRRWFPPY